jgi:hypothetical protein
MRYGARLAIVIGLLAGARARADSHWAEPTAAEQVLIPVTALAPDSTLPPVGPIEATACPCPPTCEPQHFVCGPRGRFWVSLEYLFWGVRGSPTPPLIVANAPGTPPESVGQGGVVLFGGERINDDVRPGFRIGGGMWFDCCQQCGIEVDYFRLAGGGDGAAFASTGTPILSRPFFNAQLGVPDAELIAFPGLLAGAVGVSSSLNLEGAQANLIHNLCCSCCSRVDLLVGYRFLELDEDLTIIENLVATAPGGPAPVGTRLLVVDHFRTENRFNGGQIGLAGELRRGDFFLDWRGTLALGVTESETDINGATTITLPGGVPRTFSGGLLALPSNSGHFTHDRFSVVPAFGLRLGYQLTEHLRGFVGYDFLYWTKVARPGEQIDLAVNPTLLPPPTPLVGPVRPRFPDRDSDVWVQGGSVGLEVRW